MAGLFLTGTDTGVGKTFTAAQLLRLARAAGLSCAGYKPICCGDRDDAIQLLAASSPGLTLEEVNPVWLQTPTAPFPAAEIEGIAIDRGALLRQWRRLMERFDLVIVEGVGGWLVPIAADYLVSDLAKAMALPVVIVALNRLGCLNHSLLTLRAVAADGLTVAGLVLQTLEGPSDPARATNARVLQAMSAVPLLAQLSAEMDALPADWQRLIS